MSAKAEDKLVCLAAITSAHGVRGLVKLKSFTEDPESLASYGPLLDESGAQRFCLTIKGRVKDQLLCEIDGVRDRNAAEALRGTKLFVPRSALPEPDEEEDFYFTDLIGLRAVTEEGEDLGRVLAVQDHGAGAFLEVQPEGGARQLYPFTKAVVPLIDLEGGKLVISPPEEIIVEPQEEG